MITAITRVKWTDGVSMILESSVTVFEDGDIVSYDRKSSELSCQDWQRESFEFHEQLCQRILSKTNKQS
jgi:hypothetical protein